ncbi:hypothetical protein HD806DRAFT_429095 [Xylariaceae sp. AK1471]|nr:hypothetical protein HD806DRAFT_429095 [Xylariaceae sp. AK1471]
MMLLIRAFELLALHHACTTMLLCREPDLKEKVPLAALHLLSEFLRSQQSNGSWGSLCEITSYGVLGLVSLSKLPVVRQLDNEGLILAAVSSGKAYLEANRDFWGKGSYNWIEKVTYSSDVLSEAYCLAAASISIPTGNADPALSPGSQYCLFQPKVLGGMKNAGQLLLAPRCFRRSSRSPCRWWRSRPRSSCGC